MNIKVGTPFELNINSEMVSHFFADEWNKSICLSDTTFYQWQFVSVPFQKEHDNCVVVVNDDNELLGVMGVNSRKFILNGEESNGAELTTWLIKEKYRNNGYVLKFINYLQNKYDVLIGMGITDAALAVYLRTGFHYLRAVPRYIKVIDWDGVEGISTHTPLAIKVDKYRNKHLSTKKYRVLNFNEKNIEIINREFYLENNLFSRDYKYIKWRYIEHPMFRYKLSIVSGETSGYGVFISTRLEECANGLKVLHIIDMYGDEKDMMSAITYVVEQAKIADVSIIDYFGTNSKVNSFFIKSGWFSILDDEYFKFPHLFQPLELRNPATTSMIYWSKYDSADFLNLGKLYITKQDADFDRPVLKEG
jgi:hypothetical protein